MSYMDLQSRFLKVKSPATLSFWSRLRLLIAGVIFPDFKKRYQDWNQNYFSNQYMLAVHQHYENQLRQLNKAVLKKDKKIKELQLILKDQNK